MRFENPPHVFMHRLWIPDFRGWMDIHEGMQVRNLTVKGNEGEVEVKLWNALGRTEVVNIISHNRAHESMFRAKNGESGYRGYEESIKKRIMASDTELRVDLRGHLEEENG